jgi:NhaP-type Na+/H+ or K+/H+ antiporter
MCLRWGLLLVLAEYVIRIAVGLLIGFVDRNHFANLDFARSSSSFLGVLGVLILCIGLARFLSMSRKDDVV